MWILLWSRPTVTPMSSRRWTSVESRVVPLCVRRVVHRSRRMLGMQRLPLPVVIRVLNVDLGVKLVHHVPLGVWRLLLLLLNGLNVLPPRDDRSRRLQLERRIWDLPRYRRDVVRPRYLHPHPHRSNISDFHLLII